MCVGDALSPAVAEQGPYSAIIVDLFAQGKLLPALLQPEAWQQLKAMLVPGGRVVVNIGSVGMPDCDDGEQALAALVQAFDGTPLRDAHSVVGLCWWGLNAHRRGSVCV